MSSQIQTANKITGRANSLSIGKRLLWIALIWGIQLIYIPTSERVVGGIEPRLQIDIFPVWPVWIVPYFLSYLLWAIGFGWAAFRMSDRMFRAFAMAFLITCSVSVAIFMIFPTYVRPAELLGNDFLTSLLRLLHEKAGRYNALPSGHIYITALLVYFYSRWYPRYTKLWVLTLIIISFSTLFTAQHYLLDILGGLLVAALGYYLGIKWTGLSTRQDEPDRVTIGQPPAS